MKYPKYLIVWFPSLDFLPSFDTHFSNPLTSTCSQVPQDIQAPPDTSPPSSSQCSALGATCTFTISGMSLYISLHCTVRCCCCSALYWTVLQGNSLHCFSLFLNFTALQCTALHCTVLYFMAPHWTALHSTELHLYCCCTELHCTALNSIWV